MTSFASIRPKMGVGLLAGFVLIVTACGSPSLPESDGASAGTDEIAVTSDPGVDLDADTDVDADADTAEPTPNTDVPASDDAEPEPQPAPSAGDEWTDITANLVGMSSDCGNLAFVAGHPQTDQVFAGVALQGLWELNATGDAWSSIGGGGGTIANRTTAVLFDPDDPQRFWESGSYEVGAFRTDDGGASFTRLGAIEHLDYVSVDLTDPLRQTMLAGGHERTEIYRSVDGGQSWASLAANLPADAGFASYPFVVDPTTHLLGTNSGDRSGIYRSTDGGTSWSLVAETPVASPPVVVGNEIYWLTMGGGGLVVSTDGGASFERTGQATGGSPQSLLALPGGRLATYDSSHVLVTDDAGSTWTPVGPSLPFEPWGLAYSAERESFYVWQFTCDFSNDDHPVIPGSIMQLDAALTG